MIATSKDDPPEVSEVVEVGLATAPSEQVAPPRLADAPVSMEGRLERIIEVELDDGERKLFDSSVAHVKELCELAQKVLSA